MTVERWLRLIAGILVLASVALGYFVSEWWLLLTAFVGLNLAQSSITNWCLMEMLLKKCGAKTCSTGTEAKTECDCMLRMIAGILILVCVIMAVFATKTSNYVYLAIAVFVSLLYGLYAVDIFSEEGAFKKLSGSRKVREITLHFTGTAIGFAILYYLVRKAHFSVLVKNYNLLNVTDVLLLLLALIGVAGYLPHAMGIVSNKISSLLSKGK